MSIEPLLRRLRAMRLRRRPLPRCLNLGCGADRRDGCLNVDLQAANRPDLVADASWLPQLPSAGFEEILARDVLEHIRRGRTLETLAEWNRLLRPGGLLRVRVPDLLGILRRFEDERWAGTDTGGALLRDLFGSQRYTGDFHLTGFTEPLLRSQLERTGFAVEGLTHSDDWVLDCLARKVRDPAEADDPIFIHDRPRFLRVAYRQVLGRDPDPPGVRFYTRQLRRGALSRADVLEMLADSDEARAMPRLDASNTPVSGDKLPV